MFSTEFCEILKNNYFYKAPLATAPKVKNLAIHFGFCISVVLHKWIQRQYGTLHQNLLLAPFNKNPKLTQNKNSGTVTTKNLPTFLWEDTNLQNYQSNEKIIISSSHPIKKKHENKFFEQVKSESLTARKFLITCGLLEQLELLLLVLLFVCLTPVSNLGKL